EHFPVGRSRALTPQDAELLCASAEPFKIFMVRKRKASERTSLPKRKTSRYVYYFGDGHADGAGNMKPLLGGKGANLHEMTRIGLPVPPGFTITTEVCTYFYDHERSYPHNSKRKWRRRWPKLRNQPGKN